MGHGIAKRRAERGDKTSAETSADLGTQLEPCRVHAAESGRSIKPKPRIKPKPIILIPRFEPDGLAMRVRHCIGPCPFRRLLGLQGIGAAA